MELYKIITLDMSQLSMDQREKLKEFTNIAVSNRSIPVWGGVRAIVDALEKTKGDINTYEREIEDIKLDHVKGDIE